MGNTATPIVSIQNLRFSYDNKQIFNNLSLDIQNGKTIGLLGMNGTGKSTLLYLICGLLRAKKGKLFYKDLKISDNSVNMLEDIFLVPEEFTLPKISIEKYAKLNAPFYPRFSAELLHSSLSLFGLNEQARLDRLSMGQKKKAFIAFAIATNTSLLLMDEPTNGLDIPSKAMFRNVVSQVADSQRTIIISTHQVHDIESLLDHVIIIDNSELLLNEDISRISEKLKFSAVQGSFPPSDALYSQPFNGGASVISRNSDGQPSSVDVEVLFNAVLSNRDAIKHIFNE